MTEAVAYAKALELARDLDAMRLYPTFRLQMIQLALLRASEQGALDALDHARDRMSGTPVPR